jgi:glucokinase
MSRPTRPVVLGIDLGGTKILTAVVDSQGNMLSRDHSKTPAAQGEDALLRAIVESVGRALDQSGLAAGDLAAVGVGAPGLSNPKTGVLYTSPNLPAVHDVPLKEIIERELTRKTFILNDANAAAFGEFSFGAGRGARYFIYVTVSTGIGGGIVIDGRIYSGFSGVAGEVGHMTIQDDGPRCGCGNIGCWEALASGTALAREARERIKEGAKTEILKYADGDLEKVRAEVIEKAAEEGDGLAAELIAHTAHYLGVGLANLINIFNPELIVIGGGLSNIGDRLLQPAFDTARSRSFPQAQRSVRFARAELGRNSGVLGAAAFALKEVEA